MISWILSGICFKWWGWFFGGVNVGWIKWLWWCKWYVGRNVCVCDWKLGKWGIRGLIWGVEWRRCVGVIFCNCVGNCGRVRGFGCKILKCCWWMVLVWCWDFWKWWE